MVLLCQHPWLNSTPSNSIPWTFTKGFLCAAHCICWFMKWKMISEVLVEKQRPLSWLLCGRRFKWGQTQSLPREKYGELHGKLLSNQFGSAIPIRSHPWCWSGQLTFPAKLGSVAIHCHQWRDLIVTNSESEPLWLWEEGQRPRLCSYRTVRWYTISRSVCVLL